MNRILCTTIAAFLLWYVAEANFVASSGWRIRDAQQQLADALTTRDTLAAQQAELETPLALHDAARAVGMDIASVIQYVVEPKPVAAR